MASGLEARGSARVRTWQFAGYEYGSAKAVAAAATLTDADPRCIAADTTSAAFSLTMPASPYNGMEWRVYDSAAAGSWHTNNLTIDGNGNNIALGGAAAAATITCSQRSGWIELRYDSTSDLWHASPADSSGGGSVTLNGVQTLTNKTLTAPVIGGGLTASGSAANTFAGSTGTFITSTGANTLSGDVSLAAGKDFVYAAGAGEFDGSLGTGFFKFTTGDVTWTGAAGKQVLLTQGVATTGSPYALKVTGGAHTTLTASVEANDVYLNLARTVQFATGALTTQRAFYIDAPTYGFVGASTLTDAATFAVSGSPVAGTNATITRSHALWVQGGSVNLARATVSQATNINTDVTCSGASGVITTQAATTAAVTAETGFTVTNTACHANSVVIARVVAYSGTLMTNGVPDVHVDVVSAGSFHVKVMNVHGANALNGTMKIHFTVL